MNAAHVHLMLNHAPLFGVAGALLLLVWGIVRKSREVRLASYVAFILSAVAAVVVYLTGGAAEALVEDLPGVTETAIERHEDLAKLAVALICGTGLAAAITFIAEYRRMAYQKVAMTAVVLLALVSFGVVGYTANLGGQIRHSEITAHQ